MAGGTGEVVWVKLFSGDNGGGLWGVVVAVGVGAAAVCSAQRNDQYGVRVGTVCNARAAGVPQAGAATTKRLESSSPRQTMASFYLTPREQTNRAG